MSTTQFRSQSRGQYDSRAYSAAGPKSQLAPTTIQRRDPDDDDIQIEILFCGICHSDLHQVRNEWSAVPTVYPCVPGHEIVGRVTKVGLQSPSSNPVTWLQSVVWSILMVPVQTASLVWSSSVRT